MAPQCLPKREPWDKYRSRHHSAFLTCDGQCQRAVTAPMPFPPQLIDGYRAFLVSRLRHEQNRYRELSEIGQSPQVMMIGCCDSRCAPEVIFDARPGEIF